MQKRGQVTVFIIIGVVIVLAAGLFWYARSQYGVGVQPEVFLEGPLESINKEASDCITEVIKPIIVTLAKQGGDLDPKEYKLYNSQKVKYLCLNIQGQNKCKNNLDPLTSIEEQIQNKLQTGILSCIPKGLLESKKGYTIKYSDPKVKVKLGEEDISVLVDFPLTISKGSLTQNLQRITKTIKGVPLGKLYEHVYNIVEGHASKGEFFHLPYMLSHKGEVEIQVDKPFPDNIYILNLKGSDFKFYFAVEGE